MNSILEQFRPVAEPRVMLTELIEKNKTTLIHGESGAGKTVFSIEHLNLDGVKPILIDFDDNGQESLNDMGLKVDVLDGAALITELIDNRNNDVLAALRDEVVIIDTWTLFARHCGSEELAKKHMDTLNDNGITIIIVSHTKPYSNKEDVPDMESNVYRHIKARLYIRKTSLKAAVEFHLIVEKVRGFKGNPIQLIRTSKAL